MQVRLHVRMFWRPGLAAMLNNIYQFEKCVNVNHVRLGYNYNVDSSSTGKFLAQVLDHLLNWNTCMHATFLTISMTLKELKTT